MPAPGPRATLSDWLAWQSTLSPEEIDLGLDRTHDVLTRLDLPRPGRVLTVGGTNGKGSTVTTLHALLQTLGERVGSYTSPHLQHYEERVRIDGAPVDAGRFVEAFERVEAARDGIPLTYFEFGTLAAFILFAESAVDTAILEVGLGGRLDAVNVLDHDGCVITNVSLDHCEWLGDDVESIAAEKAGIMRANRPAVFASLERPAAIDAAAAEKGARLICRGRDFDLNVSDDGSWRWRGLRLTFDDLPAPGLSGRHQYDNVAGALALLEAIDCERCLEPGVLADVLPGLRMAGRAQLVEARDRRWLLDAAHNAAGAATLAAELSVADPPAAVAVLGVLRDKDARAMVAEFADLATQYVTMTPDSERALDAERLAEILKQATTMPVLADAGCPFERAVDLSAPGDLIVVAGSFYTLGPALDWLGAGRN